MKKQFRGTALLLLATVIWGSTFVAQSVGMDHIGPFTFQSVRCLLAAIGLLPAIMIADRFKKDDKTFFSRWRDKKLWKAGALCGVPLLIACNLQQLGIVDTDAGKSAFLTAMYIVLVPILGVFLKKKPSKTVPVSVVLATAGFYFLCCMGVSSFSNGDLFLLGCALAFAVQILFIDRYAGSVDALRLNWIQAMICSVATAPVMFFAEAPSLQTLRDCAIPLCYAGFLSMGLAYSLQILGQKDLPPATAALLMSLESVFAVLAGLLFGDRLTSWEWLGCGLIFIAVILSQIPEKAKVHAN